MSIFFHILEDKKKEVKIAKLRQGFINTISMHPQNCAKGFYTQYAPSKNFSD